MATRIARRLRHRRRAGWILALLGIACLGWYGALQLRAARQQARIQVAIGPVASLPRPPATVRHGSALAAGAVVGRLEIPRLGVVAGILEGDDESVLAVAVGHLPDTPLPGMPGNVALSAHRDTFFRPLRNIREGDEVRIVTEQGAFAYRVSATQVVDPDDVWVVGPLEEVGLTLITCYPFNFIGAAPQRFVVHAAPIAAVSPASGAGE